MAPPDKPSRPDATPYQAPALEKGLEILEHLSAHSEPLSLSELGQALNRSKAEIYRMTVVLERRGYISRTADDRFTITQRLFELAMRSPPLRNLHDAALPVMHELAERLEQSCHLAVATGDEIVVVARVESPGLLGFAVRVGYRRHVTQSTSGLVLFAFQTEARRASWLASLKRTAPKDADLAAFISAVDGVRTARVHTGESAAVEGVIDIGAPVFDGMAAGPVASLTMPFVSRRRTHDLDTAIAALRDAAHRVSHSLRHG